MDNLDMKTAQVGLYNERPSPLTGDLTMCGAALDIADALQVAMSALRLAPSSVEPERGAVLDQVESRLFVVARVAEACNLSIPARRADPRGVLLPLVRRFAQAAGREGLSVKPSVEIQAGLAMAPRSLLSLGMLVYELLDGFASMPAMQARCTGLALSLGPGERGARLELRFEEDASSSGRGPELFVALNYLATDLIAALADQLGATLVIGREGPHAGGSQEILRIDGIRCA